MSDLQSIERLITELESFRGRAAARRRLSEIGTPAAEALIAALQNPETGENARWSVITVLAHIGYRPAAPVLLEILRRDANLRGEALRALQQITGEDLGDAPSAWEAAIFGTSTPATEPEAEPEPEPEPAVAEGPVELTPDQALALFQEALQSDASTVSWEDPGYVYARVVLEGDRKQQIIATFDSADADDVPRITIYTECGPASAPALAALEERNAEAAFGAFVVEETDEGGEKIVMRHELPVPDATTGLIRDIVLSIAAAADSFEYAITQSDRI